MRIEDGNEIEPDNWGGYEHGKIYIAIGWLEDVPIPVGQVPPGLVDVLLRLAESHRACQTRGYHWCTYCPYTDDEYTISDESGNLLHLGSAEIWVPGEGNIVYCAPNLIIHYIRDHSYRPPQEFIDTAMQFAS